MSPDTGEPPVYDDSTGKLDHTLTATTTNGRFLLSMPPGKLEIGFPGLTCNPWNEIYSWGSAKPATIAGLVAAGSFTSMSLFCL